jgi:hypothetical protein
MRGIPAGALGASTAAKAILVAELIDGGSGVGQISIDKLKALANVSAGQSLSLVGTAGFEPTTPCYRPSLISTCHWLPKYGTELHKRLGMLTGGCY